MKTLDFDQRTMLITALLAIFGDREMAFLLIMSSWDSYLMLCDHCDYCEEDLTFLDESVMESIVPAKFVSAKWDDFSFDNMWIWISNLLNDINAKEELEILSYYYGTYSCPECGSKKSVFDLMKNYFF